MDNCLQQKKGKSQEFQSISSQTLQEATLS